MKLLALFTKALANRKGDGEKKLCRNPEILDIRVFLLVSVWSRIKPKRIGQEVELYTLPCFVRGVDLSTG